MSIELDNNNGSLFKNSNFTIASVCCCFISLWRLRVSKFHIEIEPLVLPAAKIDVVLFLLLVPLLFTRNVSFLNAKLVIRPSPCTNCIKISSYFKLWMKILPLRQPIPTTSIAGLCTTVVISLFINWVNLYMHFFDRTFHKSKWPSSDAIKILFKYVLGCKIDVTFNNSLLLSKLELLTSSCKNLLLRIKLNWS